MSGHLTETNLAVLASYARSSMRANVAAKDMNYSRQTIHYHLRKIKRLTGIDPYKFSGLAELMDKFELWGEVHE